jgi:hypothetical protein
MRSKSSKPQQWYVCITGTQNIIEAKAVRKHPISALQNRTVETIQRVEKEMQRMNEDVRRYHCSKCGCPLSNPVSVRAGMGPICRSKAGVKSPSKKKVKENRSIEEYT